MIKTVDGLTYGDLDRALQQIGFEVKEEPHARLYLHRASGAFLPFPLFAWSEPLREHHMVAARATADTYGLMERRDFDFLMFQIASQKLHAEAA